MSRVVAFHSFRGGTGKSNTTANVAVMAARRRLRVGVIDTDIQSPGIHILLGIDQASLPRSLNDYLWGRCAISEAAHDVTDGLDPTLEGRVFLIPSSIDATDIARVMHDGYDVSLLHEGIGALVRELSLDLLLLDTPPGSTRRRCCRSPCRTRSRLSCAPTSRTTRAPTSRCRLRASCGCPR